MSGESARVHLHTVKAHGLCFYVLHLMQCHGCTGKLEIGQSIKLGKPSRWSFDSALLPQYVHGRPGIVER